MMAILRAGALLTIALVTGAIVAGAFSLTDPVLKCLLFLAILLIIARKG